MAKKLKEVAPTIIRCEPYTAEQQEARFKKEYEFNKANSARSPVSGWEDKYIREGGSPAGKKETSLVKASPSTFRGIRTANSYSRAKAIKRFK